MLDQLFFLFTENQVGPANHHSFKGPAAALSELWPTVLVAEVVFEKRGLRSAEFLSGWVKIG